MPPGASRSDEAFALDASDTAAEFSESFNIGGDTTDKAPHLSPRPSWAALQFLKFSNTVVSSGLVALLRVWSAPPAPPAPPPGSEVPAWYSEEWAKRAKYRQWGKQYLRDTALLTAASYLMDGVQGVCHSVRGVDDPLNKTLGGVAAGGLVGGFWFPGREKVFARGALAATGALVGWVSGNAELRGRVVLLAQQRRLEKEVLGVPDEKLRDQVDPWYLRELIMERQKQLVKQMQDRAEQDGSRGQGTHRSGQQGQPPRGFAAGAAARTTGVDVPDWVRQPAAQGGSQSNGYQGSSSGSVDSRGQGVRDSLGQGLPRDSQTEDGYQQTGSMSDSASFGADTGPAGARGPGRGWGGQWASETVRQPSPRQDGMYGQTQPEMQIREEEDVDRDAPMAEPAAFTIKEDKDAPR